ncbi:MAG TPA: hypothetical protein VN924_30775 [Bryobacteraceae bacterium]|nr:hypothetical protein [Bryobacteraceae bacterium]
MSLLSGAAAFSQTSEPTYINDLTTAIAGVFSGSITLAGTTLPRVKFAAHHLPAAGAYITTFPSIAMNCPPSLMGWGACPLKLYADGLISMGVDRININIWIEPYVNGDSTTQGYYTNLVNYIHSQTCNGHTCEVELDPADLNLTELSPTCSVTTMNQYQTCLTTTSAMITMATNAGYAQQPDYFTIVHECSTQNSRFGWNGVGQGTASDWRNFVDLYAGQLSTNGYTGKVGAGGCLYWEDDNTVVGGNIVPNFCGDSLNGDANLSYITYDVYNAQSISGPATYPVNMLTRTSGTNLGANYAAEIAATFAAGKTDVRIEESQSPPFVYPVGATDYAEIEPNTTVPGYRGCGWNDWNTYGLDRQWLDMIFKFASAQKMTSAAIFYTFPFFAYTSDPTDPDKDACNRGDQYTLNTVNNSLALISPTGAYFRSLSMNWPTVIATGSVKLTGAVKLR